MLDDDIVADGFAADEMLLNNPLERFRKTRVIPRPFLVHHGNRTLLAHTETVYLCPIDAALVDKPKLIESLFQILPGLEAFFFRRALWYCLIGAQENMAPDFSHATELDCFLKRFTHQKQHTMKSRRKTLGHTRPLNHAGACPRGFRYAAKEICLML